MKSITHPYKPWAKKIWDNVHLNALLPGFEFKNRQNFAQIETKNNPDVLHFRVGGLAQDDSFVFYTINGPYDEVDNFSDYNLRSYVKRRVHGTQAEESNRKRPPSLFVVNESHMLTLSGNPLIINCGFHRCRVRTVIPSSAFPKEDQVDFGGTGGIGISYDYGENYLEDWEEIHNFVLTTVKSYIVYPEQLLTNY